MKKVSKITSIVLSLVLVLSCFVSLVACKGDEAAEKAIEMYILPEDGTLLDADFSLPKTIGSADEPVEVTWASSNENAIKIVDNGTTYKAQVTLQSAVTDVTLTVSAGKASKSFVVRVDELSIYTFIDRYEFPQKLTAVTNDFELDQSVTIQDKTASIAWSVEDEASKEYISVEDDKCVVTLPDDDIKDVKIHALFSCQGLDPVSTFVDYPFSVSPPYDHQQLVNRRFSIAGDPLELSGYIVYVNEASASYGNATFWMIDDDFCSGYYLYRVKVDADQVEKVVPGAHVKVSGDTTKNFNGLWENNSGGKAVIDSEEPIDLSEYVYDFDTDLLSGAPSALWRQSTMVKLNGWKVKSLPSKPTGSDSNLMTLTRDGKDITVRLSKYVFTDTEERQAKLNETIALWDTLSAAMEKGDVYVDVVGLLGYFNAYQIQPVQASDITIVQSEGTNTQGAAIKTALDAVNAAVDANFAATIVENKTVDMPTSSGDVAISYKVCGIKEGTGTVTIEDGTFTIAPISELKNYEIKVTYTLGDYTAYSFFKIANQASDDAGKLAMVKGELEENMKAVTFGEDMEYAISYQHTEFPGLSVTYSLAAGYDANVFAFADNKVTVTIGSEQKTATLVATIAMAGQTSETVEVTLTALAKPFTPITSAPESGTYKIGLFQFNKGQWLYLTGTMSGNFVATTTDIAQAAVVTVTKSGNDYTLEVGGKYLEPNTAGSISQMKYAETSTEKWQWNDTLNTFTCTLSTGSNANKTVYFGTYGTFDTISGSETYRVTGNNASAIGVSQFVSKLFSAN